MSEINIESQYQLYLKRVNQVESEMHPQQKIQLRQTFYAACGQMLVLFRDEFSTLDEEKAIETFEDLTNEIVVFFDQRVKEDEIENEESSDESTK